MSTQLLFDIGGTRTRLALSRDGETIGEVQNFGTAQEFPDQLQALGNAALKLIGDSVVGKVSGGLPGVLNRNKSVLLTSPHLPRWVGVDIKESFRKLFGGEVELENDAALAALGEARRGAGKGYRIVAYIGVGTGVGGARVVGGKIDERFAGFEPGHQIIDADGTLHPEAAEPTRLEGLISGSAFERRFGIHPRDVTDTAVWDETAKLLAAGLHNTIVHWSPETVVLGGSMFKTPGISVDRVRDYLKGYLAIHPELPELKRAELGEEGALYGALALS